MTCGGILRSLALSRLLRYFSADNDGAITYNEVCFFGAAIVIVALISAFIGRLNSNNSEILGMKVNVACASLMYSKCLTLNRSALGGNITGLMTNLMVNDLSRILRFSVVAHFTWIGPLHLILVTLFLYYLIGWMAIVGIPFMALIIPLQVFVARKCSEYRLKAALNTDERTRLMSEILNGIKLIKMYTWEEPFIKLMDSIRRAEMREISAINYIKSIIKFVIVTPKVATLLAVGACLLSGNNITAYYAFVVTSFYDTLKLSFAIHFIYASSNVAETLVAVKRIEDFLLLDDNDNHIKGNRESVTPEAKLNNNEEPLIYFQNVSAKWYKSDSNFVLNEMNLRIYGPQLTGIIGLVGSGKSSILQAVLKEITVESGVITVKGRISYASQDPWVFSGSVQQNILFGRPMDGMRYRKILDVCALDQDIATFPYGDKTFVGEKGIILSGGQKARVNLARAIYADADIYLLDDPLSAVDIHVGRHIFEKCIATFLNQKSTVLVTHQLQYLDMFKCVYVIENGRVAASGTYEELKVSQPNILSKMVVSVEEKSNSKEEQLASHKNYKIFDRSEEIKETICPSDTKENRKTGGISLDTFVSFVKSVDSNFIIIVVIITFIVSQVAFTAADYSLVLWVNEEERRADGANEGSDYPYIYAGLITLMVISTIIKSYVFFKFCTLLSIGIYRKLFVGVMNSALNFFHINNSGRILNRFTKDISVIDEEMPFVMIEIIQISLMVLGIAVIVCIVNSWLLISSVVICLCSYVLRTVCISTIQDLARLKATSRSPVLCHITETLQGLPTIRSSNSQTILKSEFNKLQNFYSAVFSLNTNCNKCLALYIELFSVLYIATIIVAVLLNSSETFAGNVGVSITQGFSLSYMMNWGILQACEFQNQMTSVERILEYSTLEPEDKLKYTEPPKTWPSSGKIEFLALSLRYGPKAPYVLNNLSFCIESAKKVGVVGRTGAGKSSLLTALFQLWPTEGTILIDEVDITKFSLISLRSKISIIPQDPVLFHGSVRSNLDPFNAYEDHNLWESLEQVELKVCISELRLGLNHIVSDGGSNFSVGQRQLVCLARALLRRNKILVLDEATANVDPYTDALIQNTIRKKFANCTVITIAHRINTIMDSDKVLVMGAGKIVEYDHPYLLLQNPDGIFYSMLHKCGPALAKSLTEIAKQSYQPEKENSEDDTF